MEKGTIVLVATLDTKGQECLYVKKLIAGNDYKLITVDVSTGARGELIFFPDYPREEVVKAAGSSMEEITSLGERGQEMLLYGVTFAGECRSNGLQKGSRN